MQSHFAQLPKMQPIPNRMVVKIIRMQSFKDTYVFTREQTRNPDAHNITLGWFVFHQEMRGPAREILAIVGTDGLVPSKSGELQGTVVAIHRVRH